MKVVLCLDLLQQMILADYSLDMFKSYIGTTYILVPDMELRSDDAACAWYIRASLNASRRLVLSISGP